jgi:hypothetical protein
LINHFAPGLVASPSLLDLAAEGIEEVDGDDTESPVVIEDDDTEPIILTGKLLDQFLEPPKEPVLSLSFRYSPIELPTFVSGSDSEEHTSDEHSQYLSPLSVPSLLPVVKEPVSEEYEPEGDVFESESEDDEAYHSKHPHLSRPQVPPASQSMSSLLHNIVENRKSTEELRKGIEER